ncbi:hypothetical protein [Paludisphaera sp.]|uniref:hypothetical protein n=1 Tax=Paludisphaera sp. TaxID=2017432 RepID=UPI00301C9CDA
MGATIYAYIEYDDAPEYYPAGSVPEPFAQESDRVIDLTTNVGLSHAKDYVFLGAIGGPRNPKGLAPLIRPRGLPPNVNWRISKDFDPQDPMVGWLTPLEIEAALDHMEIRREELSFGLQVTLDLLQLLGDRLGPERVRFVFEMGD